MKFSEITNRTCLYLLGGIAGMEGSILNIITTKDNKLFFEFCNEDLDKIEGEKEPPIESYLPICIWKETNMKELEELLSEESLAQYEGDGPFLNEIMKLEGNPIYLEKELNKEYIETSWSNKYIQSRMEDWLYIWNNLRLLDFLNWNFDHVQDDETILEYTLKEMNRKES